MVDEVTVPSTARMRGDALVLGMGKAREKEEKEAMDEAEDEVLRCEEHMSRE